MSLPGTSVLPHERHGRIDIIGGITRQPHPGGLDFSYTYKVLYIYSHRTTKMYYAVLPEVKCPK